MLSLFGLTGFAPVAALGPRARAGRRRRRAEIGARTRRRGQGPRQAQPGPARILPQSRHLPGLAHRAGGRYFDAGKRRCWPKSRALISRSAALGILEELSHLESRLRYALAKDVVFEVALIQMSQLKEKISLESILESLGGAPTAPGCIAVTRPHPRADRNRHAASRATPPVAAATPPPPVPSAASASAPSASPRSPPPPLEAAWKAAVEKFAAGTPDGSRHHPRGRNSTPARPTRSKCCSRRRSRKNSIYLRSPRNLEFWKSRSIDNSGRNCSSSIWSARAERRKASRVRAVRRRTARRQSPRRRRRTCRRKRSSTIP